MGIGNISQQVDNPVDGGQFIKKDGTTTTTASIPFAEGLTVAAAKTASIEKIVTPSSSHTLEVGGSQILYEENKMIFIRA